MHRFVKIFSLILAIQMGCVAFGLWVYNRYVVSVAVDSSRELAWEELSEVGDELLANLEKSKTDIRLEENANFDRLRQHLDSTNLLYRSQLVVVDSDWKVHFEYSQKNNGVSIRQTELTQVSWDKQLRTKEVATHAERGMTQLDEQSFIGWSYPLTEPENVSADEAKGRLLILRSLDDLRANPVAIAESLPMVGVMTFFSICGLLGISMYLLLKRFFDVLANEQVGYERRARQQERALVRTRDGIVFGLAKLAESRDRDTGWHLERMSLYSARLASELRGHPSFQDVVTPVFVRLIEPSSVLHDIGKVGIEDRILLKPGPLTDSERDEMQSHPTIGGECIKQIEQRLGKSNFLQQAREIAFHHHERWDGCGYPTGLSGEDIPLAARIVAIADVYDALTNARPYKEAFPHELAVSIIGKESGKQFDPRLVDVFLKIESQFAEIARQYHAADFKQNAKKQIQSDSEKYEKELFESMLP